MGVFGSARLPLRLLVWLLSVPPGLAAQLPTDAPTQDSVRYLGGITVDVARASLTTGGASVVSLALDSVEHLPAPSMEEVVRSMPLVRVRTNSRGEAQPALRGARDRQITVLLDGVPLTLGWDHRTDMSIVPLTAATNVTLVRGLASVLHGPNTLGGVLEIDVARPERRVDSIDPLSAGISLDHTGGTNASVIAGRLVDQGANQWTLRVGAGLQDRPGVPVPDGLLDDAALRTRFLTDGDLRLNSDARRVDGFVVAGLRSEEGGWASLSASASDVERGVPPEAHQDVPRLWRYPDQRRLIAAISAGTGRQGLGAEGTGLEGSLGLDLGSARLDRFATEAYRSVTDTEVTDDRVLTARVLGRHELGRSVDVSASVTFADIAHDEALTPGATASFGQRLWSLGSEATGRLGSGGRTTVSLGGTVDGAQTPEAGGQPRSDAMSAFGVRLGASSLVRPGLLVHGGLSRRARFPSLRELYSTGLGRFEPNPSLQTETLFGVEGGFTARGRLGEVQVMGFHHRLEDGIVRMSVTGPGGSARFMRVNRTRVRTSGVELLLVGEVGGTTLTGDLTIQDVAAFDASGGSRELEYEPSVVATARFDAPLVAGLRGGAEVGYVGSQFCENPEVGGLQSLASSRRVDFTLRRTFDVRAGPSLNRIRAQASLWNATDAGVFDQCGLPRPGRLLQLQVRLF